VEFDTFSVAAPYQLAGLPPVLEELKIGKWWWGEMAQESYSLRLGTIGLFIGALHQDNGSLCWCDPTWAAACGSRCPSGSSLRIVTGFLHYKMYLGWTKWNCP
jgi:hypothetical protein